MLYHKYSKTFVCIGALIALVFTATCSLQPVSSIRVKASPKIYLPLGSKSITEDEVFKRIEENVSNDNKNIRLYRYQPSGDDKLHYLVHYPLQTLELDINKYFGKNALSSDTALSYNVEEKISIPTLDTTQTCTIANPDFINSKLLDVFNKTLTGLPAIPVPAGTPSGFTKTVHETITFKGFKELTFEAGASLTLSATTPSGITCSFSNAKLTSKGNTFTGSSSSLTLNEVKFTLDKPISNELKIDVTVTLNGTASQSGEISFKLKLDGTIQEVKGVNAELKDLPLGASQTVVLPLPADFKKAVIGDGSLQFLLRKPDGWSGIEIKEKTKIEQAGSQGLDINPSEFRILGDPISLTGVKLNNSGTLTYTPNLEVVLKDATYRRPSKPISAGFKFSIKKFSELTLKTRGAFDTNQNKPIPQDMKDWVKKIDLNKVNVTVGLYNGLPADNPIKMKLRSEKLKIQEQTAEFPSQKETTHTYTGDKDWTLDVENTSALDLHAAVELPNYDHINKTFTLKNISTGGDPIKVTVKTTFALDWKEITLKAKTNKTGSFPDTGVYDLSKLTSKLDTAGIKLKDMPMYFYAGSDLELSEHTPIAVKLEAQYHKKDGSSETKNLINTSIDTLKALPAGTFPANNKIPVYENLPPATLEIKKGETGGDTSLTEIMNAYPKDLKLSYTLSVNEIKISETKYKEYKEKYKDKNPKVSIDLVLDVPVEFEVDNRREASLTDLLGIEIPINDLFGRSGPDASPFGIGQIPSDALKAVAVRVRFENGLSASSSSPKLVLKFKKGSSFIKDASGNEIQKVLTAAAGEQSITITSTDLEALLNEYPVLPELRLELSQGSYSLKRDFNKLGASLSVSAEMDIDYKIK